MLDKLASTERDSPPEDIQLEDTLPTDQFQITTNSSSKNITNQDMMLTCMKNQFMEVNLTELADYTANHHMVENLSELADYTADHHMVENLMEFTDYTADHHMEK